MTWRLCYVDGPWAWFTTRELSEQWGDDWDDAPYEHNSGGPYRYDGHELMKVAWEGPLLEPHDGHCNSPYSVKSINAGACAWLRTESWVRDVVCVPAGVGLEEFKQLVESVGGSVYERMK